MRRIGYMVVESCIDFEQVLGLDLDSKYPNGGVLTWTDTRRTVFPSRSEARKAINRTEHYRLAFEKTDFPERKQCKVVPLVAAP